MLFLFRFRLAYAYQSFLFFFFFNYTPTTEIYTYGHPLPLPDALPIFGDREEASFGIRSRLNENWSIRFQHRRDLIEDRALRTAISLGYQDECFLIEAVAQRTNYRDRELEEDDSIFVRVVRSEEHTSELKSLMRISYAVFCLKKK